MKKLCISQPMIDKTDEEIFLERQLAIKKVEDYLGEEVTLIDSFMQGVPHDSNPLYYLSKSLEKLSEADIIYFCRDWTSYRGCTLEHAAAVAYNIPILLYADNDDKVKEMINMDNKKFLSTCYVLVANYYNEHKDKSDNSPNITTDDVYVVWLSKTLGNNKALLSTCIPDGMYYEITYNGEKNEFYFDAYKKWENKCISGSDAADQLENYTSDPR